MLVPALLASYSTSAFAASGIGTVLKNKFLTIADELTIAAVGIIVVAIIAGAFQSMILKTPVSRWIYGILFCGILVAFASEIGQAILSK